MLYWVRLMRESMSVWMSLYIVVRRCRVSLLFSPFDQRSLEYITIPDCYTYRYSAPHSLHAHVSNKLSTWLSYVLSRLKSRPRCRLHRHQTHRPLHHKCPRSRGSVAAKTTVFNAPKRNREWTPSSRKTTSTKHQRRQKRRTRGLAASVKSSSNDSICMHKL